MTNPFLSVSCNPCAYDFIAHRQGHIVREKISMRIQFGDVTPGLYQDPPSTDLHIEIWDIPPHLIHPNGTVATSARIVLGLRDLLSEHLGMDITEEIGSFYSDISFHPAPGKPGHFALETWINANIAFDVLGCPLPESKEALARPKVMLDPTTINPAALKPDATSAG